MNKEKYFVPEESDLRLGYEYETNFNVENKWKKKIVNDLGCESDGCGELQDLLTLIYYNNSDLLNYQLNYANRIRVPYLTKEQIENESWKFTEQINNKLYFKKGAFVLTFEDDYINIDNTKGMDIGYWGKCKDINTFRYLIKLLEI